MAKYYVQSGTMRTVVQAQSGNNAALWAVHQAMQQVLPIENCNTESPRSTGKTSVGDGLAVLSSAIRVSEQGFDRSDAKSLVTIDVVTEWTQLIMTLDRLEQMLYRGAA